VRDPDVPAGTGGGILPSDSLYEARGSLEVWEYLGERLPVPFNQYYLHAVFLETNVDDNDYILDRSNAPLMNVLGRVPEALVANPDLTEAPEVGLIPGTSPASADELRWVASDPRPWPDETAAYATSGLVPGRRHFLWLHLDLDENSLDATSVVGQVRDAETGEELGSFVVRVHDAMIDERVLELSIPVVEGEWLLDVALFGESGPLVNGTFDVATTRTQNGRASVSPFVWGVDVRQVPDWKIGDPFNIGGWRVAPVLNNRFLTSSKGNLGYMTYVFNPELDADGSPQFTVSITLHKDGKQLAKSPPQPAPLAKMTEGVWVFGRGLPLERFSEPGSYTLTVELEQTTDGTSGSVEIPFEMIAEDPASSS
jgi:hypothetical protein